MKKKKHRNGKQTGMWRAHANILLYFHFCFLQNRQQKKKGGRKFIKIVVWSERWQWFIDKCVVRSACVRLAVFDILRNIGRTKVSVGPVQHHNTLYYRLGLAVLGALYVRVHFDAYWHWHSHTRFAAMRPWWLVPFGLLKRIPFRFVFVIRIKHQQRSPLAFWISPGAWLVGVCLVPGARCPVVPFLPLHLLWSKHCALVCFKGFLLFPSMHCLGFHTISS